MNVCVASMSCCILPQMELQAEPLVLAAILQSPSVKNTVISMQASPCSA